MSQDKSNETQILSYTNLDFSSIYSEVLDTVKKLTKDWDPSISDESDPGVVLVKLSALLSDKMNYNIDKNILEAFPLSVTQESNARQLYDQLGYHMGWYQAATTLVSINWNTTTVTTDGSTVSYTIPKFTTITDDNENVIYSLVGTYGSDGIVVSDGALYADSAQTLTMLAYEGIPTQYTFNNKTTITANMVDDDNRLYLSTANVFENGIFIKNVDQDNYAEWHRVNNLYEYSYNDYRYKFGYDSSSNTCYLEFPDNYADLFGSGLEIVYLTFTTTDSAAVPAQYLSKFVADVAVTDDTTLTSTNTTITNTLAASGHTDKESIDDAYDNYKRVVGTFKTLITLRDYLNYIRSKDLDICSNALVTDRTNDIQSTYKIISKKNNVSTIETEVEQNIDTFQFVKNTDADIQQNIVYYSKTDNGFTKVDNPTISDLSTYYIAQSDDALSPFSLKLYMLQQAVALTSKDAYDNTFEMIDSNQLDIDSIFDEAAHIVHTFEDIEGYEQGTFELSADTIAPVDTNGVPEKIYYKQDDYLYTPVAVTSLSYQAYNPNLMGLYEDTSYYTQSTDNKWYDTTTYYIINTSGEYIEYSDSSSTIPPKSYIYHEGQADQSLIYIKVIAYSITSDTSIDSSTTYYEYKNGEYVVATLPSPSSIYTFVTSDTIASIDVVSSTFANAVSNVEGEYLFTASTATKWQLNGKEVTLSDYGITISGSAKKGDSFIVAFTAVSPKALGLYELKEEALLSRIIFFKNKYPLDMSISTYATVDNTTKQDILNNIYTALYSNLDSNNIEFGDSISLDYLTDTITSADARIKSVSFDALTYTTYAVYYDAHQNSFVEIALPTTVKDVNLSSLLALPTFDTVTAYLFSKEIICKSILAGKTQLIVPDTDFNYHINQDYINLVDNIKYATGEATIDMAAQDVKYIISDTSTPTKMVTYELQKNEVLNLYRPKLNDKESFSSNVHYDYLIYSDILANQTYELQQGEYFIFYVSAADSEGALASYTVYVYSEGSILTSTEDISQRNTLSTYGYSALQIVTAAQSTSNMYSYSESRSAQLSLIQNDTTISNTLISTNNTITVQTLSTFTLESNEGYRMLWVLNTPTYQGAIKQYQLLPGYDPEEDVNLDTIDSDNTYTLKSGEYIYYTDSSMSNLGILGAGTSVTRECGIHSEMSSVITKPYVFVNWNDLKNSTSIINASGFALITDPSTLQVNPKANGFYELVNNEFVRTTDTTPTGDYYVLVMKDVSGYYIDSNNTYTAATSPTSTVFSLVDLAEEYPSQDVSPYELGLFEKISYNNSDLLDTYYLATKDTSTSDEYLQSSVSTSNTVYRYANVLEDDSSIVTSKFLYDDNGKLIDTTNLASAGNITQEANSTTLYPYANNWVKKVENKLTKAKVSDTLFDTLDLDYSEDISNKNYYYKYSKSQDNTYKKNAGSNTFISIESSTSANLGIYGNSTCLGNLFETYKGSLTGYELVNKVDTEWLSNNILSDSPSNWRLSQINDKGTGTQIWGKGQSVPANTSYVKLAITDLNDLSGLSTTELNTLANNIIIAFTSEDGLITVGLFLKITTATLALTFGSLSATSTLTIYDDITEHVANLKRTEFTTDITLDKKTTIKAGTDLSKYITSEIYQYSIDGVIYKQLDKVTHSIDTNCNCSYTDTMTTLVALLKKCYSAFSNSYNTGLFFQPLWFEMQEWYAYTKKDYYRVNQYAYKTYTKVDPLVCNATDSLTLSSNPIAVLQQLFQGVQPNTSLTFTQNDMITLSEGDTVTCTMSELTSLPKFTNKSIKLDLDQYSVSYQKQNQESEKINKLTIENCDWYAYSNLELNTSSVNGQRLYPNHTLAVYSSDMTTELATLSGSDESNIYFQLKYPVENRTGEYIDVNTVTDVGAEQLNEIYCYNIDLSTTEYAFVEDEDVTLYVYAKKLQSQFNPNGVDVPVNLPVGKYLLPITGYDDIRIEVSYGISNGNPELLSKYNEDKTYCLGNKTHYLYLEITDTTDGTLNFKIKNPDGSTIETLNESDAVTITVGDIYKFENNPDLVNCFDEVKEKLIKLDKNQLYDYTYIVDDNDIIEDPLQPKSLWNKNHISNPFTIGQLNVNNITYKFIS